MTDKIKISLDLPPHQLAALAEIERDTGISRSAAIRLAIHAFCLAQSSTYRTKLQPEQPAEQPTEQAA